MSSTFRRFRFRRPASDLFPLPNVTVKMDQDRWIRAVEIRPSNRQVAHHAVLFAGGNGLLQSTNPANVLAVWAVGTPPTVYPEGTGRWLRKDQVIATNLHYHPNGTATTDRMRVGFYFGSGELEKEVATAVAGNVTFEIPPHATNYEMRGVYVADQDISVVSFFPHMHLRGKNMTMTATFPDGRRQVAVERAELRLQLAAVLLPARSDHAAARHARRRRGALRQLVGEPRQS